MNLLMIAPDLESKFHKSEKGFAIPYPILFSTSGLQLLAALTPEDVTVTIVDETIGETVDYQGDYDLVAITLMTTQASRAYKIGDRWRELGKTVVMGGYHASVLPEEALLHCDSVTIGEGELTWPQLLADFKAGTLQRVYQSDRLIDMKDVPWPRRELITNRKNGMKNFIQTSRGCPHSCSFCSIIKFFGHTYRTRPVEDVIAEITHMKERGLLRRNMVFFSDDNIAGSPTYAKELFRALIPLKIKWGSQCSISIGKDPELLALARESGCVALAIGFESTSDQSLAIAKKGMGTASDYVVAIKAIHGQKIAIFGLFIFGFDSDDVTVFDATYQFIHDNNLEYAMFSILTPLPGTIFYDQFREEKRLLHQNWEDYDFQHVVFEPKRMTAQELQNGRYTTAKRIHSVRSILKRVVGAKTNLWFPLVMNGALRKLYQRLPRI